MHTKTETVRGEASLKVLWKWTGVSALLHGFLIASLCGISYLGFQQREVAAKAKAAAEEAAAKKAEADEAAKTAAAAPSPTEKPAATPTPAQPAPDATAKKQAEAEKVLGIDKATKPEEMPNSPFSSKNDDLLKDLK